MPAAECWLKTSEWCPRQDSNFAKKRPAAVQFRCVPSCRRSEGGTCRLVLFLFDPVPARGCQEAVSREDVTAVAVTGQGPGPPLGLSSLKIQQRARRPALGHRDHLQQGPR